MSGASRVTWYTDEDADGNVVNYWTWNDPINKQTRITWEELQCPTCGDPMFLAYTFAYGHSACYWCIHQWFKFTGRPACLKEGCVHEQDSDPDSQRACAGLTGAQERMRDRWTAAGRTFWIRDNRRNPDVDNLFNLLATEITCLACLSVPSNSFILPCGHSMCYTCIWNWLLAIVESVEDQKIPSCPSCRRLIDKEPIPNIVINSLANTLAIRPEALENPDRLQDRDTMAEEEKKLMDEHSERGGGPFLGFWRGPFPQLPQWEPIRGGQRQVGVQEWLQQDREWRRRLGLFAGANQPPPPPRRSRTRLNDDNEEDLPDMDEILRRARAQRTQRRAESQEITQIETVDLTDDSPVTPSSPTLSAARSLTPSPPPTPPQSDPGNWQPRLAVSRQGGLGVGGGDRLSEIIAF